MQQTCTEDATLYMWNADEQMLECVAHNMAWKHVDNMNPKETQSKTCSKPVSKYMHYNACVQELCLLCSSDNANACVQNGDSNTCVQKSFSTIALKIFSCTKNAFTKLCPTWFCSHKMRQMRYVISILATQSKLCAPYCV